MDIAPGGAMVGPDVPQCPRMSHPVPHVLRDIFWYSTFRIMSISFFVKSHTWSEVSAADGIEPTRVMDQPGRRAGPAAQAA
jgi:hypothetical protein